MAGETGVGEYTDMETEECCGDDDCEFPNECYTTSDVEWGGDPVVSITGGTAYECSSSDHLKCCSDFQCIGPDGNCYSQGSDVQFYYSGNDTHVICYVWGNDPFVTAGWGDCDGNPNACECSSAVSGESEPHGEYTQDMIDNDEEECCGDDEGENYICNTDDTSCKCCAEQTDILEETSTDVWECVAGECGTSGDECTTTEGDTQGSCCETDSMGNPLYCSQYDDSGSLIDPHCCPEGEFWDEDMLPPQCNNYASCYDVSVAGYCNYLYNSPISSWWTEVLCIGDGRACCPADMIGNPYGDGEYHYWNVEPY